MATITNTGTLFPSELASEIFNKVKGHSTLAKLSAQTPIPFAGTEYFMFSMDGEAEIVGEGGNKSPGDASVTSIVIKPLKFVYQHRVTDEFVNMSDEKQIPYLEAFTDGFAKKIARGLDIAAMHGTNPATGEAATATVADNYFDGKVTQTVTYDATAVDDNIDDAVAVIQGGDGIVTGIALAPAAASALGKMKASGTGTYLYPEFRFGANPGAFGGMNADINSTLGNTDMAIVGDFANAFRWGYAEDIPMEIIQYGDPDGLGDLKRTNQIVLRAEAYIGWGILDAESFARVIVSA